VRIYRMTATFGKLEHATLELQPGLNIISAPNEWGKSTWCAFLLAMLYGLDTRTKTTKTSLSDKDRYAPWSGAPMAGRIDLNWNGRDITIERRTKRRVPMGDFQAYETHTGLPVEELTALNCGQKLLGVEQTVFRRAGFIRQTDLPVTEDEALRRRLNALVTTGDDSDAADKLAGQLRDLRNRCRYHRSGLIPQTQLQRQEAEDTLRELENLETQCSRLHLQLSDLDRMMGQLQLHRQTLAYAKMEEDLARLNEARTRLEVAEEDLAEKENCCASLPEREEVAHKVRELTVFKEEWRQLQLEERMLPIQPVKPELEGVFSGMEPENAREMVSRDAKIYTSIAGARMPGVLIAVGIFGVIAGAVLAWLMAYLYAAVAGVVGLIAVIWGIAERRSIRKQTDQLVEKYGSANPKQWDGPLARFEQELVIYQAAWKEYQDLHNDLEVRLLVNGKKRATLCGGQEPEVCLAYWQQALECWDTCLQARREAQQAKQHYETVRAMVKPVEKPEAPDSLTQTEEETNQLLAQCTLEQQRLSNRLGQCQGRMAMLGSREDARRQLERLENRLQKLEDTYAALVIAQETLEKARAELQRRFAPRITRRAQSLLSAMTGGRYKTLTMGEDFSLRAGTAEEDTVYDAIWRSDGTMDQLYLSLRLAVAGELTPNAPLILDDALVRFDDARLKAAVNLLREMSAEKQIICFTCQGREAEC